MRKPIIAGNWKMNKTIAEAMQFAEVLGKLTLSEDVEALICAPFTALKPLTDAFADKNIGVGAQNFHFERNGAYTGEISASMLKEIGAKYVIIGHSERRQYFAETDETVNKKLHTALAEGITPIVCVGESLEQRENIETEEVIESQIVQALDNVAREDVEKIVIAYEPIWAIGTGKTATSEQANEVCAFIRSIVKGLYRTEEAEQVRIQYGGSVKPSNIKEIMAESDIDGALIGGASLEAEDFAALVNYL